jgi:hypothetical protein
LIELLAKLLAWSLAERPDADAADITGADRASIAAGPPATAITTARNPKADLFVGSVLPG